MDTADKTQNKQSLSQLVKEVVDQYFSQLDGEATFNLYELVLTEVELPLLAAVLDHTGGNQSKAANILGLSRGTLRKKLKIHDFIA